MTSPEVQVPQEPRSFQIAMTCSKQINCPTNAAASGLFLCFPIETVINTAANELFQQFSPLSHKMWRRWVSAFIRPSECAQLYQLPALSNKSSAVPLKCKLEEKMSSGRWVSNVAPLVPHGKLMGECDFSQSPSCWKNGLFEADI